MTFNLSQSSNFRPFFSTQQTAFNRSRSQFNFANNGYAYGAGGFPPSQATMRMMPILFNLLQMLFNMSQTTNQSSGQTDQTTSTPVQQHQCPPVYTPPIPQPPVTPPPPVPVPPVYEEPPVSEPPVEEPPVYEPPTVKVLGSAGLFGDPHFGLFTPNLGNIPAALRDFSSGIQAGQTVTLLNDTDLGGLNVTVTGVQVDPLNTNSVGVGQSTLRSGNDVVSIHANGNLIVNGQVRGNINDNGFIAPITLANGLTISTASVIDGPNNQTAERFVITNGEYKITAAVRKPHADSNGYLDMNFEELLENAADNATGYQTNVPGLTNPFGIVDLLRLEPGDQ